MMEGFFDTLIVFWAIFGSGWVCRMLWEARKEGLL